MEQREVVRTTVEGTLKDREEPHLNKNPIQQEKTGGNRRNSEEPYSTGGNRKSFLQLK